MDFSSPFRTANNKYRLSALFLERPGSDGLALYSLKNKDVGDIPSLYRLYMEAEDPLEFTFANTYFEGWEHWSLLCSSDWFKPYIAAWRRELELKIKSEALARLRKDAAGGSKSSAMSNRYLLDGGWKDKPAKGRPSKAEVKRAADEQAEALKQLEDDLTRIQPLETDVLQ